MRCLLHTYSRNPDDEGRLLERALAQNPDNFELRQRMLHVKLRSGRLDLRNGLVRLAGHLGDPNVQQLAGVAEVPASGFLQGVVTDLLSGTDELSKQKRIEVVAGITCLFLPLQDFRSTADSSYIDWTPSQLGSSYTDEELLTNPIYLRLIEVTGLPDDQGIGITRQIISNIYRTQELRNYLLNFTKSLQIPPGNLRYGDHYYYHILASLRTSLRQRDGWQGSLIDAARLTDTESALPKETMLQQALYEALQNQIWDALYTWDISLLDNPALFPYLHSI